MTMHMTGLVTCHVYSNGSALLSSTEFELVPIASTPFCNESGLAVQQKILPNLAFGAGLLHAFEGCWAHLAKIQMDPRLDKVWGLGLRV
jgi:hypothetical protein